mmetsp:Transcript_33834/g.50167  ORF Transcript_33834/g.50167 Transcript_33834/m.50167 type:complete len:1099 (-) Transcript_33834:86-3382(-)
MDSYDEEDGEGGPDDDDEFFSEDEGTEEEYRPEEESFDDDSTRSDDDKYDTINVDTTRTEDYYTEGSRGIGSRSANNEGTTQEADENGGIEMAYEEPYDENIGTSTTAASSPSSPPPPPPFLSEVAMRMWCFFVLYNDKEKPHDNFARQVEAVLDDMDFEVASKLVSLPLPEYANVYLEGGANLQTTSCLRNEANNFCKAVIHRVFFFVGRYDFKPSTHEDGLLLHRSNDGETVLIRAQEYIVRAEAVEYESLAKPGDAEAAIWETGDLPAQEPEYTGSSFTIDSRKVCFKFMKNREAYDREVKCRQTMGVVTVVEEQQEEGQQQQQSESNSKVAVLPLINHYCADDEEQKRQANQRYRSDIHDDRFKQLDVGTETTANSPGSDLIRVCDYPYAIVVPFRESSTLFDHFLHHGRMSIEEIREIGAHLGRSIQKFHRQGLILGNLLLDKIAFLPPSATSDDEVGSWVLTDLSSMSEQESSNNKIGAVAVNGSANFSTSTFPPELFVKLNPGELKMYNDYWEAVKTMCGVEVDRDVVGPKMDPTTNETYVAKCCYVGASSRRRRLPPLPYDPVPARETVDVWSFGQLLFTLCSSGHPLFPTNLKTGNLLSYGETARWNAEMARSIIFRHVEDPLAQDLLLHILSDYDERATLDMETVLSHPFFFTAQEDESMAKITQRIVERRSLESTAYRMTEQQVHFQQAQGEWLSTRSSKMVSWDLDFQMRMYLSPSNLVRLEQKEAGCDMSSAGISEIPVSMLVLPYRLTRNKAGKLTPATKKDVERAERMGVQLLALSKACRYATLMEQIVTGTEDESHTWSSSEISAAMALSSDDFKDLEDEMASLAAKEVERFRDSPLLVARRLVQERVKDLQACFEEDQKGYLYLVDEYAGVPILESPYPHQAKRSVPELVQNVLPFMYMSTMYVRGVMKNVTGLVQLIFEAAYPHTPSSWTAASAGLVHDLDEESMRAQLSTLRHAIAESMGCKVSSARDELRFLESYLHQFDPTHSYAKLQRATTNADSCLWTRCMDEIHAEAATMSLTKAYAVHKAKDGMIEAQAAHIKELERQVERLQFRKDHNLTAATTTSPADEDAEFAMGTRQAK